MVPKARSEKEKKKRTVRLKPPGQKRKQTKARRNKAGEKKPMERAEAPTKRLTAQPFFLSPRRTLRFPCVYACASLTAAEPPPPPSPTPQAMSFSSSFDRRVLISDVLKALVSALLAAYTLCLVRISLRTNVAWEVRCFRCALLAMTVLAVVLSLVSTEVWLAFVCMAFAARPFV